MGGYFVPKLLVPSGLVQNAQETSTDVFSKIYSPRLSICRSKSSIERIFPFVAIITKI